MNDGPVIFWWGSDLRILDGGRILSRDLAESDDPVPAILEAMAQVGPGAPARIVYYPEGMKTQVLDGGFVRLRQGFGGRARLRRRLAKDFSALAAADTAWSAAPIPGEEGMVVYLDRRSRLPALVAGLARAGRRIEGAWPLPLLVEAEADSAHRGSLSLVATAGRTLVTWFSPAGGPGAEAHSGAESLDSTAAALRGARARFDEGEPSTGWLAIENGPWAEALRQTAEGLSLTGISLADLLARVRLLSPGGPADFLAPPAWWARRKWRGWIAAAAGVLLLAGAAAHAWSARAHRDQRQRELADQQTQRRLLQREEAAGHTRQNQIDQLTGELARLESPPQHHYELLMALARAASDTVVLESVTTQGADFAIAGRTEENAGISGAPLSSFSRALAAPGAPWTLGSEPAGAAGTHFTLAGRFQPPPAAAPAAADPAAGTAEAVARWTARLEAERAGLSSAAAFEAQMRKRDSRWIVSSESADPSAGSEVRHYTLTYERARLDDWSDLVESIRDFCAQPGLTIDRLTLASAPDGAEVSLQAGLSLSVRLRP